MSLLQDDLAALVDPASGGTPEAVDPAAGGTPSPVDFEDRHAPLEDVSVPEAGGEEEDPGAEEEGSESDGSKEGGPEQNQSAALPNITLPAAFAED